MLHFIIIIINDFIITQIKQHQCLKYTVNLILSFLNTPEAPGTCTFSGSMQKQFLYINKDGGCLWTIYIKCDYYQNNKSVEIYFTCIKHIILLFSTINKKAKYDEIVDCNIRYGNWYFLKSLLHCMKFAYH